MHLVTTMLLILSVCVLWLGIATDSDILMLVGFAVLIGTAASF